MSKLLSKAKRSLEMAKIAYNKMNVDEFYREECCYSLQQTIERTLKYILEIKGIVYPLKHNIAPLIKNVEALGVKVSKVLSKNTKMIDSWEAESRYSDNFYELKQNIEEVFKAAEELITIAENIEIPEYKLNIKEQITVKLKSHKIKDEDIEDTITIINNCIPPTLLNRYGKNKLERVLNFADTYFKTFNIED